MTQEGIVLKGVSKDFVKRSGLTIEVRRNSMKKVYVCGSFRFTREMEELERELKEENIQFQVSKKTDSQGILGCLKKVDDADVVYVVNPQGYIGKSVSVDIGYAYAKNKSIYVMHAVDDPPIMNLISDVLSPKALIDFLKEHIPRRH
jgi:hypothetical protein